MANIKSRRAFSNRSSAKMEDLLDSPGVTDLLDHLAFDPSHGTIWLRDTRMVMLFGDGFSELRNDLIDQIGLKKTQIAFSRLGYTQGLLAYASASQIRDKKTLDALLAAAPQLQGLLGFHDAPIAQQLEYDIPKGTFYSDTTTTASLEAEAHVQRYGIGTATACWHHCGYASGFSSALMGKPILMKEVECIAAGHSRCRLIGKCLEDWDDQGDSSEFLELNELVNRFYLSASLKDSSLGNRRETTDATRKAGSREIVGISTGFKTAMHYVEKVAPSDASVLLLGESGVGKELFAETIHAMSKRAEQAFVAVNCAALPKELTEAELFGVARGAYTGAVSHREGRFELAAGGTLFLDEIGLLNYDAQGKLLRVLDSGIFQRVGETRERNADVRILAATNEDLTTAVKEGRFRRDLFHRISVFPIEIPPLRNRRADIPLLLNYFIHREAKKLGKTITGLTRNAVNAVLGYEWPGNVREIENAVARAVILADDGGAIDIHHLFSQRFSLSPAVMKLGRQGQFHALDTNQDALFSDETIERLLEQMDQTGTGIDNLRDRLHQEALHTSGGNVAQAAKRLGISWAQMNYWKSKRL